MSLPWGLTCQQLPCFCVPGWGRAWGRQPAAAIEDYVVVLCVPKETFPRDMLVGWGNSLGTCLPAGGSGGFWVLHVWEQPGDKKDNSCPWGDPSPEACWKGWGQLGESLPQVHVAWKHDGQQPPGGPCVLW